MASYGYTFQSGDGVTPTRLNDARTVSNIVDADISASAAIAPSKLNGQGYIYVQTLYYTAAGTSTFSKATYPWLRAIRAKCQGAGGGGGGCAATGAGANALGSAGGGGSYAEKSITDIAGLDASVTITVGAGGSGGSAGNNAGSAGGNSSFGTACVGNGGTGGNGGPAGTLSATFHYVGNPANGATGGTGDLVVGGGPGEPGYGVHEAIVKNGAGGYSFLGRGGFASTITGGNAGGAGTQGGGGSGGSNAESQSARAGGAGGDGVVILELFA